VIHFESSLASGEEAIGSWTSISEPCRPRTAVSRFVSQERLVEVLCSE
jgi:hypothetical protein